MDWIEGFLDFTSELPSPELFRKWSAITAISGALDRRVWVNAGMGPLFPNLYTLLVGPPGSGKSQAVAPVKKMWLQAKNLHVAPDNVTKAALVDSLHKNSRFFMGDQVPLGMLEIHSVLFTTPEFGVFMSKHDLDFLSILNHLYDNPENYREERRSMEGRNPDITNPQLTILAGTQPDFLSSVMPEEAWGMGFCSRLIMVYAPKSPKLKLFNGTDIHKPKSPDLLLQRLTAMTELFGEMRWDRAAKLSLLFWYESDMPPIPDYPKLAGYRERRLLHALKLITISAVSRNDSLIILEEDVDRVKRWMAEAEAVMPDIFRAMMAKSDADTLGELHRFLWDLWAIAIPEKRVPVPEEAVYSYLKDKLPSERIEKVLDVAMKTGMISHSAGGGWIPKPIIEPLNPI